MKYTRRTFVAAATSGTVALAGCIGQEATPTPTPATDGSVDTPSPPATSTPTTETDRASPRKEPSTATATETQSAEPTRTETETPHATDTDTPAGTDTRAPTATPPEGQTVIVGPDGTFRFDPEDFTITAGATVRWEWEDDGHNVRPSSKPDDSTWSGTPGGDGTTYDEGYTYEYTFAVPGKYEYYCAPHQSLGMTGSFTVE